MENGKLINEKSVIEFNFSNQLEEIKEKVEIETKSILSNDFHTLRENFNKEKKNLLKKLESIEEKNEIIEYKYQESKNFNNEIQNQLKETLKKVKFFY